MMIHRVTILAALVATAILGLIVQSTTPQVVGPGGILAVFFLLYIILTAVIMYVIIALNQISRDIGGHISLRKPVEVLPAAHSLYYSSVLALGPILILGMGSVGKSGVAEWALVALFMAVAVFYLRKRL
ncbi:hypothetical protein H6796_01005 [Candidatus Nomurabacteria bacterium]|nr:hypothetical protein [Candidatus Nomurabacteria bacterium]